MDILGFDKLIYHPEKVEKLRRGEAQFPKHVTVSLGNYCNHKCLWCSAYEAQKDRASQMDADVLTRFLEQGRKRGLKAVGYVGNGEPTAHKRFGEIVERVASLGLQQGMFTNGYLLNRHMDVVLSHFTYVRISLDAGSREMHAAMHDVPAQFDRIAANLRELVARRSGKQPTLGIQYATHHENLPDIHAAARLSQDIGADYFSIKPVFTRGSVGERIAINQLSHDDFNQQVARIRHDFESPDFQVYFRPFQVLSNEAERNILPYDRCVAGFFNLNLYENGDVVYCGPKHVAVGNMSEDLDVIEQRILDLSTRIDLSQCPAGCRYHQLNHIVDTLLNSESAEAYHPNFL